MKNAFVILLALTMVSTVYAQETTSPFGTYQVVETINKDPKLLKHLYYVEGGKLKGARRPSECGLVVHHWPNGTELNVTLALSIKDPWADYGGDKKAASTDALVFPLKEGAFVRDNETFVRDDGTEDLRETYRRTEFHDNILVGEHVFVRQSKDYSYEKRSVTVELNNDRTRVQRVTYTLASMHKNRLTGNSKVYDKYVCEF